MARDLESKCKKCRRSLEKLFLKGDRCYSPKCAVVRRAYPPGAHGKKMTRGLSEYGTQLAVKQKIKRMYGILERQFRHHFDEVKGKKGVTGDLLLTRLEMRLDNICYRIGFGGSRSQARQLVNHGLIYLNGRKVTIPSREVKAGDIVSISENKKSRNFIKGLEVVLKNKKDFPSWIDFNAEKLSGRIIRLPQKDELDIKADVQMIVGYYSR